MDESIRNTFCDWAGRLALLLFIPLFFDDFFPVDSFFTLEAAAAGAAIVFLSARFIAPRLPNGVLERTPKNLRTLGRKYIASGEVYKLLGDYAFYLPEGQLAEDRIREADSFVRSFYGYRGCELIQADYRTVSIEMGHVELTNEAGNKNQDKTVFEGHCLLAETDLNIEVEIQITEKSAALKPVSQNGRELTFEDVFKIECRGQALAGQILTPRRKARILEIYRSSTGAINLLLKENGSLLIACEDDEDKIFLGSMSADYWRRGYSEALSKPLKVLDVFLDVQ